MKRLKFKKTKPETMVSIVYTLTVSNLMAQDGNAGINTKVTLLR